MSASKILLSNTNNQANVVGDPVQADGWYGFSDGLHTVSMHVANFTGRIKIQASLALEPAEEDWFDITLTETTPYLEFPLTSTPTGLLNGDTRVVAVSFKANVLWIRAVLDRSYLQVVEPYDGTFGVINKIILSV